MATEDAYTCLLAQQSSGKIAASVPDDDLHFLADSEGWLLQANHLLHTGLTMDQYLEFDCKIAAVETDRGGSMMTAGHGNLAESRAAKQRARNTRLTMHDGAVASSGGGLVTAAAAAQENTALVISSRQTLDRIPAPANWPFSTPERINNMVGRVRTRSMEMMANRDLSGSTRKKAYTVRTALANNDKTYVTIAKDMLPTKPGSQDVLNVCLTQASLEMQMKK
jgi:hypothetical protein